MRILYIGYWGANEGLSQATINPHLEILAELGVEEIIYITIERSEEVDFLIPSLDNLTHYPLRTDRYPLRFFNKFYDFVFLPKKILGLAKQHRVNKIICRSSLAGFYGNYIHKRTRISYYVESFEPHADYMIDAGVWKKFGFSALMEKKWEHQQMKHAKMLMPVSEGFKEALLKKKVSEDKIHVMPCGVSIQKFAFNDSIRSELRSKLGISDDTIVGIYVGKFSGIYYSLEEAFSLFRQAYMHFKRFHLIILTPFDARVVIEAAESIDHDNQGLTIDYVHHDVIPNYLSAADFAFSLHKPVPSMRYVSPIKNGEYWANGLPIIISDGIGDDSLIVTEENAGVLIDFKNKDHSGTYAQLQTILDASKVGRLSTLAEKYRSFNRVKEVYQLIMDE